MKSKQTFYKPKFTAGFSIAEIVVVIGIMALLTTLVYTSLDSSKKQSRDQKRVAEINKTQLALEQFYARNKYYPESLTDADIKRFLSEVSTDIKYAPLYPISSRSEGYMCRTYHLWVTLESKISVLDSKKGFNSSGLYEQKCGEYNSNLLINASSSALVYDVIPN